MAALTLEEVERDHLAMTVAKVLALANETAVAQGTDPTSSLVSITEEANAEGVWRVHYGPRNYIGRRGGDLMILVDQRTSSVQRIIRGQ